MNNNDPWAAPPAQPIENYHALCIEHENGVVHVRSTTEGYPRAGWALTRDRIEWCPDLYSDDESACVAVRDIRLGSLDVDPGPSVEAVVAALRRSSMVVHGYSAYYDAHGEGPTVKYRRTAQTTEHAHHRYIHNVDYGFEAGSWYFGHPVQLERALAMAKAAGVVTYEVRGADLESFAVDATSDATAKLNDLFAREQGVVHDDQFRPAES